MAAEWSKSFESSYARLNPDRQKACDKAIIALIKRQSSPGLRVKPIHPDKYYNEARLDSGNRIVFRIDDGTIFFVDVIIHDKNSRYGRRPSGG